VTVHRRTKVATASLAYDVLACLLAVLLALAVRNRLRVHGVGGSFRLDWSASIIPMAALLSFWWNGLYNIEAYLSRRIHVWLLVRAFSVTALITAALLYLLHSPANFDSRLLAGLAFSFLFVFVVVGRGLLLGRFALHTLELNACTLVVGQAPGLKRLSRRLHRLRGFGKLVELDVGGHGCTVLESQVSGLIARSLSDDGGAACPIRTVFIDAAAMSPRVAVVLSQVARRAGCEVYVASMLVRALSSRRLLLELFQTPTVRVRTTVEEAVATRAKRVFDVVGATVCLALLSPLLLVVALAVRLSSRGTVFYPHERIGRDGLPFTFYKFRTMVAGGDHQLHQRFVYQFIQGELESAPGGGEGAVPVDSHVKSLAPYKIADDPRVTRVGRLLRKYSLDELPQLWNVIRGDMSLVGPRPPLPYEVRAYEPWHRLRLVPTPGVSGLWQVQGRSRVTFDEMVLQDVMYACNRTLLTDGVICLRTIPAAILGRGAA
jgi:exopolysaccharide biosynthesis polyprenyl glycosylphosphotransferase